MTRGREEGEWLRAGQICATIANSQRGSRTSRVFRPVDFMPGWLKPEPPTVPHSMLRLLVREAK